MLTSTEELAPDLLERVLGRLGLSAPPRSRSQWAQNRVRGMVPAGPFDNIRKLIHVQAKPRAFSREIAPRIFFP